MIVGPDSHLNKVSSALTFHWFYVVHMGVSLVWGGEFQGSSGRWISL